MRAAAIAQLPTLLALRVAVWWRRLDLEVKLAVAASGAVVGGLATVAWLVAAHIEETLIRRAGAATALYTDGFVAAHIQELATKSTLSAEHSQALVRAELTEGRIEIEITDVGVTLGPLEKRGLSRTRDRVEALGVFLVRSGDHATSITARFADPTREARSG